MVAGNNQLNSGSSGTDAATCGARQSELLQSQFTETLLSLAYWLGDSTLIIMDRRGSNSATSAVIGGVLTTSPQLLFYPDPIMALFLGLLFLKQSAQPTGSLNILPGWRE